MTFSKFMDEWSKKLMAHTNEKPTQEYTVTIRIHAVSPEDAAEKAAEFLNAGGEPDSIIEGQ